MTASTDEFILDVEGIDFSYGQLQVLFGISVQLRRGEALALLGTNGAGKSTLLKVIAGMVSPTSGHVRFDGRDITGTAAESLVGRGLVLLRGGHGVFNDMTVAENLEVQALTLGRDKREAARRRVMETFPTLAERRGLKAGLLSGGQQQQLVLAKAIMLEPKVICIDELSLGLAPIVVQELLTIVRAIHERGTSIILVEQSLNIASEVCERAVFLEKGEVRFEGPTRQLLERDDIARAVFLGASR
jgi:ABC-type branched-subunit amino acid transport system ATPase component